MGFLMDLLFLFFFWPVLGLFALSKILGEVSHYYGLWLPPAVFGLIIGVELQVVGPSAPDAVFESLPQTLAGSHIASLPTPLVLIGVGVFCLLAKPVYRVVRTVAAGSRRSGDV